MLERLRSWSLILGLVLFGAAFAPAPGQIGTPGKKVAADDKSLERLEGPDGLKGPDKSLPLDLKTLAEARIKVINQIMEAQLELMVAPPSPEDSKSKSAPLEQLRLWNVRLLEAQRDLSMDEYIKGLERHIASLRRTQELDKKLAEGGTGSVSKLELMKLEYELLEAETWLVKAKAKMKAD